MISGIGTDIVAIDRFQRFIDENNTALLKRLFTERERSVCEARKNSAACLAARFAAKEAFLKALGTGLSDGISWHDMEVFKDGRGKPGLATTGRAAEISASRHLGAPFLALSHDAGYAVATVVLEVA